MNPRIQESCNKVSECIAQEIGEGIEELKKAILCTEGPDGVDQVEKIIKLKVATLILAQYGGIIITSK